MSNKTVDIIDEINDAFNGQNDQPFKKHVADNVVVQYINKKGEITPALGKQKYLELLKDTWKRLKNPRSENIKVTTQQVGSLTKAVIIYDSTFTPPSQANTVTEPATAIMYFDANDKLIDATYATR